MVWAINGPLATVSSGQPRPSGNNEPPSSAGLTAGYDTPSKLVMRGWNGRVVSDGSMRHAHSMLPKPEDEAVRRFVGWKHRERHSNSRSDVLPSPQDVYADLMKTTFAPALRAVGLRGSNGRFELPSDVYWAQLGFFRSPPTTGRMRFDLL